MNVMHYQGDDCAKALKLTTSPITAFFKPRAKEGLEARESVKREAETMEAAEDGAKKMKLNNSV